VSLLERIWNYERQRRFWRLVDVRGRDECWAWRGESLYRGRPAEVHAYELMRGPLPAGSQLRRRCPDVRCVNPDHMELVDRSR
jgi:hypothetical protein